MSRTDKEMPWWVIAPWYEPHHVRKCEFAQHSRWLEGPWVTCTLPARAVRGRNQVRRRGGLQTCIWTPVWPSWREARHLHVNPVPRWYVRHIWWDRERTRQRGKLGELVKEFNSNADLVDGDFPSWQHRHCATWYWD